MVRSNKGEVMSKSMMDFILASIETEKQGGITLEEWTTIRRNGTPEEIEAAVERMEAAGGYDNLE